MLTNRALCWVEENDAVYRWNEASTTSPDGVTVVRPSAISGANPGRWFLVQTHNADGDNTAEFYGLLASGNAVTTTIPGVNTPTPIAATTFLPANASTAFSLDSGTGIITSLRNKTYLARVTIVGSMVVSGSAGQNFKFIVDLNNQTTSGQGSQVIPTWKEVSGRVSFNNFSYLNIALGDTLQMKVINLTDAQNVSLLPVDTFQPNFWVEEMPVMAA